MKMNCQGIIKVLCLSLSVLILGSFATTDAQQRKRNIITSLDFPKLEQGCPSYEGIAEVYIDQEKMKSYQISVLPGAHTLRIGTRKDLNLTIKEITYEDWDSFTHPDGSTSAIPKTQTFKPNAAEASVPITVYSQVAPAHLSALVGCGVPEAQKRLPIIFLPGVAGTMLYAEIEKPIINSRNEVWPFSEEEARPRLAFNDDAKTPTYPGSKIVLGDIFRTPGSVMNFYGGLLGYLHASKEYKEAPLLPRNLAAFNQNLFTFPYDWRLDNALHFPNLDKLVDDALKYNPDAKKVILMAHSMGGYIARGYILSSATRAAKVDSLITMGTPYWGAPKPYYGVVSGYTFGNPTVRQELMKVLLQNMPAAYQLMPNYPFIVDSTNKRMLTVEESWPIRYKGFANIIHSSETGFWNFKNLDEYVETPDNAWSFNDRLVKLAGEMNKPLGDKDRPRPLPAGVKHYAIIGTGVKTLALFYLRDAGPQERFVELGRRKVILEPFFSDGDGTVPLQGSEISTATATYYIPYSAKASSGHGDLPAHPIVQQIVGEIIDGNPPNTSTYKYSGAPRGLKDVEVGADFTLHSDAHLSIVDERTGRLLGFNNQGGINEDLPSGSFLSIEGVEYASIADINIPLKVLVTGIRNGKFTLDVNVVRAGSTVTRFSYPEVPVKKGTVAQVNLIPGQVTSPPPLSVTTDGRTANIPARGGTAPPSAGMIPPGGGPGGPVAGAGPLGGGGGTPGVPSPLPTDLTGLWLDNTGGGAVYRLRQVGNKVYWSVDAGAGGSINVYVGDISGNTINGVWVDLPQSGTYNTGNMNLRIESKDRLVKLGETPCCYGAQEWRRQGSVIGIPQRTLPQSAPAPGVGGTGGSGPNIEPGIDRPGHDYSNFDLKEPRPELCQTACASDSKCKAYTYVKPGLQGPNARCWLKSGVPNPQPNSCCVSGVKGSK